VRGRRDFGKKLWDQKWFDHFSEDTGHEKKRQTSRGKGIFFPNLGRMVRGAGGELGRMVG